MVDEAFVENRDRIKKELESDGDSNYEEIFMTVMQEIDAFNYFLKSQKISKQKNPNVVAAVASIVRFLLLQPIANYNQTLNVFNLKKVRFSNELMTCFKHHAALFYEFDISGIPYNTWVINSLTNKFVQIMLEIDPSTQSVLEAINDASKRARIGGWNGELQIITRSKERLIFPTS